MNPRQRAGFAGGFFLLLAGCAGDHNKGMRPSGEEGPRLAVPFHADRRDQWGPASLAGILNFWGHPATAEGLRREIHFPKQRGSVALDLKNAARARGLAAEMSTGTLESLKKELDAGRPVIVLVNTGFKYAPISSFMVVSGYNDWLGGVYAHFGPNKDYFLKYRQFDSDWKKAGRWILLVDKKKPEAKAEAAAPVEPPIVVISCPPPPPPVRGVKRAPVRCPAPDSKTAFQDGEP